MIKVCSKKVMASVRKCRAEACLYLLLLFFFFFLSVILIFALVYSETHFLAVVTFFVIEFFSGLLNGLSYSILLRNTSMAR